MEALAISARIDLDRGEIESASKLMADVSRAPGVPLETGLMATAGLVALARGESGVALEIIEFAEGAKAYEHFLEQSSSQSGEHHLGLSFSDRPPKSGPPPRG